MGSSFSAAPSVVNNHLGGVTETTIEVSSTNRHEYPDDGVQNRYYYKLKPQLTTFIKYTNSTAETLNVELYKDRYTYTHDNVYYNKDTSLYGTVVGTAQSTNEDSIPDASWRKYLGLYLGESIPFLNIVEHNIPESEILGVPAYDKQVNTSETLKYGTVASASLTFTLNLPVEEAMLYNNDYLILFYDFENIGDWKRFGFFYIDNIESIDEYTSRITAHDEAYKLNKYVDSFLENYQNASTLKKFYTDLLDYCGCYYDSQNNPVNYGHLTLDNIYHAVKTTGTEVAHYIATISTGFIHADIDGDIKISTYSWYNTVYKPQDYAELQYSAYNADIVNKVKITINNVVVGESDEAGENTYYVEDNPLISSTWQSSKFYELANDIRNKYDLPAYRPATIKFLTYPEPKFYIGTFNYVETIKGERYYFAIMRMSIDASGITLQSFGTQSYPVEQSTTGQFVNLINNIDSVDADVSNLERASELLGQRMEDAENDIDALETRMGNAESNISTVAGDLQSKINNDSISLNNNLATIKINGTSYSNITNKTYVDNKVSSYVNSAISTSEGKNSVSSSNNLGTVKINNNEVNNFVLKGYLDANNSITEANNLVSLTLNGTSQADIATKDYVDANAGIGPNGAAFRTGTITFGGNSYAFFYIGNNGLTTNAKTGLLIPLSGLWGSVGYRFGAYSLILMSSGRFVGLQESDGNWWNILGATVNWD